MTIIEMASMAWETYAPKLNSFLTIIALICLFSPIQYAFGQQPAVELHYSPENPEPDDEVEFIFKMGDFNNQATNVWEIDETFSYAEESFQFSRSITDTVGLDTAGSWFADDDDWSGYLIVDSANKEIILHLERPSDDPRSGYDVLIRSGGDVTTTIDIIFRQKRPFSDNQMTRKYNLYPNPSTGYSMITSSNGTHIRQINILSLMGQRINSFSMDQAAYKMDLSMLSNQVYVIEIIDQNGYKETKKWIKQ